MIREIKFQGLNLILINGHGMAIKAEYLKTSELYAYLSNGAIYRNRKFIGTADEIEFGKEIKLYRNKEIENGTNRT